MYHLAKVSQYDTESYCRHYTSLAYSQNSSFSYFPSLCPHLHADLNIFDAHVPLALMFKYIYMMIDTPVSLKNSAQHIK